MLNTVYKTRIVDSYSTTVPTPSTSDKNSIEKSVGGDEKLVRSLDVRVMQIQRDTDIQHGGDNCVIFFEDTTGELIDICNVDNITKGMGTIQEILKVNGNNRTLLKNWEQAKGLYQISFGCKTAHFYIRQY